MNGVLSDKEFEKLYDECLSRWPERTERMLEIQQQLGGMFDEYVGIVTERAFRLAYQLGYEAAIKETLSAIQKGGAI